MVKRFVTLVVLSLIVFSSTSWKDAYPEGPKSAAERERSKAAKPMAWDLGPDTVDISGYPQDVQVSFRVFEEKCGNCHGLARPLNAPYATEGEWNTYVNKMMRKPGSGITKNEAKQIFGFLVYDSKERKLSDPDAWEKHLKRLIDGFKKKYGDK